MIDGIPFHRRKQSWIIVILGVVLALGGGIATALVPPGFVFVGFIALLGALWMCGSIRRLILVVLGIATLIPFGTLPFKVGLTPAFLELAILGLFAAMILRGLLRADQPMRWSVITPAVLILVALSFFSFLIGSSGRPDSMTAHNYFKFLLAVAMVWGIQNAAPTPEAARWVLRMLLLFGMLAAIVGIGLWAAPDELALKSLTSLAPFGYPESGRVLRYVEDDPNGVERAIGTSVDPNSFGGLMALIGAIALAQALAPAPILPRKTLWFATGLMAISVYLTQSRAALGGFVLAAVFLATVRYRRLWWVIAGGGIAGAVLIIGLGKGGAFVERVVEGLQFKDLANQMRLAEFRNAIAIIREYPWFGVGFGAAPSIDLTTGVSSIYLTIASRMGLIGLTMFLGTCASFFIISGRAIRRLEREQGDLLIGLQAGIVAALAVGLLDHYFFNIEFPHMVMLFWLTIGIAMTISRTERTAKR